MGPTPESLGFLKQTVFDARISGDSTMATLRPDFLGYMVPFPCILVGKSHRLFNHLGD